MHSPIKNARLYSGYKTLARPYHSGVDITPWDGKRSRIAAAFTGTVAHIERDRLPGQKTPNSGPRKTITGNYIAIENTGPGSSGDGEYQVYNHVLADSDLKVGDVVEAGAWIGYTDLSGNNSGHHVHFECWTAKWGQSYNPMNAFKRWGVTPGADTGQGSGSITPVDPEPEKPSTGLSSAVKKRLLNMGLPATKDGVKTYQRTQGLKADGVWGPVTERYYKWALTFQAALNRWKAVIRLGGIPVDGWAYRKTWRAAAKCQEANRRLLGYSRTALYRGLGIAPEPSK